MELSFEGIGQVAATFATQEAQEEKLSIGQVVTLTAEGTVGLGTAGAAPCGVILALEKDQKATVQVDGFVQVAYTGDTAPTVGWGSLGVDGNGGVQVASSGGRSCLIVQVDTAAKTAVIKL
ncbi:MAG TPA: hypothetical protein IAC25_06270 [Candidatus Enterenecus stercoripullorum]|nr:hypothetical protein [Candidatus Enterenecus stercoripullorum]